MPEEHQYPNQRYIGDGVYANFDGYQIIIKTHREDGTHYIAIESAVLKSLNEYWAYVNKFYEERRKEGEQ